MRPTQNCVCVMICMCDLSADKRRCQPQTDANWLDTAVTSTTSKSTTQAYENWIRGACTEILFAFAIYYPPPLKLFSCCVSFICLYQTHWYSTALQPYVSDAKNCLVNQKLLGYRLPRRARFSVTRQVKLRAKYDRMKSIALKQPTKFDFIIFIRRWQHMMIMKTIWPRETTSVQCNWNRLCPI